MTRTKTRTKSHATSIQTKKATPNADRAASSFAEHEDIPEAQTISELKLDSDVSGADSPAKKTARQKKKDAKAVEWSIAERLRFKWGVAPVKVLSFLIRAVLFVILVLVVWTVTLTIASGLVPGIAQLVSDGTGVTFESRLDEIITGLLLPTLFLNGLLFVLVCMAVKKLWVLHVRLGTKARNVLLGDTA